MNFNELWHMDRVQREKAALKEIRVSSTSIKNVSSRQSWQYSESKNFNAREKERQ